MRRDKRDGMHQLKQKIARAAVLFVLLILSVASISPMAYAAGDAHFTLSSSGGTNTGDTYTITVSVSAAAGDNANSVDVEISYPTSLLTLSGTSVNPIFEAPPTGSGVGCASNSASGGTISIACASSSAFSGTVQYATLSFTVRAGGSSAIAITSSSGIDGGTGGGQDIWDHTLTSLSPTFTGSASGSSGGSSPGGGGLSDTGIAILSIIAIAAVILLGAVVVRTVKRRKQASQS